MVLEDLGRKCHIHRVSDSFHVKDGDLGFIEKMGQFMTHVPFK